jgi:uncharacterized cofD-like protein
MDRGIRICTIGGGSGMPVVNRSLVKTGFVNISSIVTTFDSGGDSGRMRTDERGKILAFSDYWRALLSLWKDGKQRDVWEDMMRFRDGRERNFGNLFFQFMSEKSGGLSNVECLFKRLTGANIIGKVLPVSSTPSNVCFKTKSGKQYCGEHNLDSLRMSDDYVVDVWMEPRVKANQEALNAIREADVIIVCPGSLYGSVITNFLPVGIRDAFVKSKANKILMTNIMLVANENNAFDQYQYLSVFEKYLKITNPFHQVLMADLSKLNQQLLTKVLGYYLLEHSKQIVVNNEKKNVSVIVADIAMIERKNMRLRHCEAKLIKIFRSMKMS